jgi:hypothetical protein
MAEKLRGLMLGAFEAAISAFVLAGLPTTNTFTFLFATSFRACAANVTTKRTSS